MAVTVLNASTTCRTFTNITKNLEAFPGILQYIDDALQTSIALICKLLFLDSLSNMETFLETLLETITSKWCSLVPLGTTNNTYNGFLYSLLDTHLDRSLSCCRLEILNLSTWWSENCEVEFNATYYSPAQKFGLGNDFNAIFEITRPTFCTFLEFMSFSTWILTIMFGFWYLYRNKYLRAMTRKYLLNSPPVCLCIFQSRLFLLFFA